MIFKDAEPFLICPQMEIPDAKAAGWSYEVIGHQDTENSMEVLAQAIVARQITPATFEKAQLIVERLKLYSNLSLKLALCVLMKRLMRCA